MQRGTDGKKGQQTWHYEDLGHKKQVFCCLTVNDTADGNNIQIKHHILRKLRNGKKSKLKNHMISRTIRREQNLFSVA